MITLYVLKQSRANRIAWLLAELNLAYQVEIFERDRQTKLAPSTLKNIYPFIK